ncbi:hypothetical protein LX73_0651 [Fodinibius salinus]|uniref:Uncharacterized protein n=1 Tax=Fodinibius salinus TaxID=860790 RepID=A0A5D3YS36_9BACT|nr:hypothetical protein LX73_0651 [Fodinibius salinus]
MNQALLPGFLLIQKSNTDYEKIRYNNYYINFSINRVL